MPETEKCDICGKQDPGQGLTAVDGKNYCSGCLEKLNQGAGENGGNEEQSSLLSAPSEAETAPEPAGEPAEKVGEGPETQNDIIDDLSYIKALKHLKDGFFEQYDILLDTRIYGWQTILNWADYLLKSDIDNLSSMTFVGIHSDEEIELIERFRETDTDILSFDYLNYEGRAFSIAGTSRALNDAVKIVWFNQTRTLRLFCLTKDEITARKYIETLCRKSFGTPDEMKLAKPHDENKEAAGLPVSIEGQTIKIDTAKFFEWRKQNPDALQYEFSGAVSLAEREPVLTLLEDGVKTAEYCLQTENGEDFTGKYFLIFVRLSIMSGLNVPVSQIDGFISDTPDEREFESDDIGFRMEGHFLACGGEAAVNAYKATRGMDIVAKGLKYPGYTVQSNLRLLGICPDCGKSFAFHCYSFYLEQVEPAYSDDGLDVCEITDYEIDKENWNRKIGGKTYRYYNSFCCPHCGKPYVDYKNNPANKQFGLPGYCHLGRKVAGDDQWQAKERECEKTAAGEKNTGIAPAKTDTAGEEKKSHCRLLKKLLIKSAYDIDSIREEKKAKDRKAARKKAEKERKKNEKERKKKEKLRKKKRKASNKKESRFAGFINRIFSMAVIASLFLIIAGMFLNAGNLNPEKVPSVGLAVSSGVCFALGVLIIVLLIIFESNSNGSLNALVTLYIILFAFSIGLVHAFFALVGFDIPFKKLLPFPVAAGVFFVAGLVLYFINRTRTDTRTAKEIIRDDAVVLKKGIVRETYYKYEKSLVRIGRNRVIQKYPEKSLEKRKDNTFDKFTLELLSSWTSIWIFTVFPLIYISLPALIYRIRTNADKDSKTVKKRAIPYTAVTLILTLLFSSGFFFGEFSFSTVIMTLLISPVLQTLTGFYYLIFYQKSRNKRIKKDELCKDLILKDKITDINSIADSAGLTYSGALKTIDKLIADNIIKDAFIDYSGEEVLVKGITDKIAIKCENCGGTSVFKANEIQKCKWCGADYE